MTEEQAKQRFMILNVVRLLAVAVAIFGIAIIRGKVADGIPDWAGYLLLVFGVVDFFAAPIVLKKLWQNQDK